jgi:hypothetical protein
VPPCFQCPRKGVWLICDSFLKHRGTEARRERAVLDRMGCVWHYPRLFRLSVGIRVGPACSVNSVPPCFQSPRKGVWLICDSFLKHRGTEARRERAVLDRMGCVWHYPRLFRLSVGIRVGPACSVNSVPPCFQSPRKGVWLICNSFLKHRDTEARRESEMPFLFRARVRG